MLDICPENSVVAKFSMIFLSLGLVYIFRCVVLFWYVRVFKLAINCAKIRG